MKILPNLPHQLPDESTFDVVTLGVFDGVHRGHQRILDAAVARAAGRRVAVLTFDPHPRAVLGPQKPHRMLSTLEERLELLAAWPLDGLGVLRFDAAIARWSYRDFVRRVLLDGLGARTLVVGHDTRLGHEREGTPDRLAALGSEWGFEVVQVPALEVGGRLVSSTRVREALDAGDAASAAACLGRHYALQGTVIRGAGRGRTLGVPTANLEIPREKLVPAHGVYAVRALVRGAALGGALHIGVVPTFRATGERTVEVHLLDWEGDLYGDRLRVECVRRLREERKFPDAESLRGQMQADLAAVRIALASS